MRAFAATGAVWNRETLDAFITNSRKFVKGTFMILKLKAEDCRLVLDYLERVAVYGSATASVTGHPQQVALR